jgi:spermidine synthase
MLFVDLFVGSELDSAVTSVAFLRLCKGSLSPYGVAAFNLPAADKAFVQRCGAVFGDHNVFRVPVPASSNEVVLVRGGAGSHSDMVGPALSHRHLYRRAQELSAQYRLPYDLANHFPVWWRLW